MRLQASWPFIIVTEKRTYLEPNLSLIQWVPLSLSTRIDTITVAAMIFAEAFFIRFLLPLEFEYSFFDLVYHRLHLGVLDVSAEV